MSTGTPTLAGTKRTAELNDPAEPGTCQAVTPTERLNGDEAAADTASKRARLDQGQQGSCLQPACMVQLRAAYSEDKGCRNTMEDVAVLELDGRSSKELQTRIAFFGVFDGHGGSSCAEFVSQHLHSMTVNGLVRALGTPATSKLNVKSAKEAVTQGFKVTDDALLHACAERKWMDGACAACMWVVGETVLVANVGDARAVLARLPDKAPAGTQPKALLLTKEHLAIHASERTRIERAGGHVSADGRLNGRIMISRSFGDAQFKKAGCSAQPDISAFELTPRDCFMLLGCDGFWGVFPPQVAVDTACKLLQEGKDEKAVTNRLINMAVRELRCKDNCTCLLVRFCQDMHSG